MSEEAYLLRLTSQADKEFVHTALTVTATAAKFSTQLTTENTRKAIYVYNNESTNTCYWGRSTVTSANGMPIPAGSMVTIPVSNKTNHEVSSGAIDIYFVSATGETCDLRILEIA